MAVQRIESYTQKDGREILKVILNPTPKYPQEMCFYVDKYFEDLIRNKSWGFIMRKNTDYVVSSKGIRLHREIAYKCLGHYPDYIDHENHVGIDNVCSNLSEVTNQQNQQNSQSRGYLLESSSSVNIIFRPQIKLNEKHIVGSSSKREDTACLNQYWLETEKFSKYNYNFLLDRRGDLDILDLERTGQISADDATLMHVKRYVEDTAWFIYRYNLFDYCKQNNIIIPRYSLNIEGRMVHPITGQILCPFKTKKEEEVSKSIKTA